MHALSIRAYNTRDISPALKGGASGLTTRVSCFNRGCVRGSRLSMSDAPSTGSKNREPLGQIKIGKDMFADKARFRGGVPLIDFHQRAPVPTGFVVQLAHELPPADVADGFGKVRVLDHVLHRQTLHAYDLVFVNDARREVVLVVPPAISDTGVNAGDLGPRFAPVLRAFFLPGEPPLRSRQSLLVPGK